MAGHYASQIVTIIIVSLPECEPILSKFICQKPM
jgi:hypothetical protein